MPFVSSGHIWLAAIVLVIVLVIWGPGKLADAGGSLGRGLREFRRASSDAKDQFTSAVHDSAPQQTTANPSADEKK